ncbi:uncharacterized protein LOC129766735 [Toxorhynchites rutilus septentrionalis]|uniref:uncharacterized protein LOC129766735 n=1 Tax=Toxorhynchites rutilus septentrionalis TaxID=329112 RepID=UPI00247A459E|nr:uncharacterized protein LOC129766735 [Toxorhynchites rutilus septentrionalis]
MPESDLFNCPLCEQANNVEDMVMCDQCEKWIHYSCAGYDEQRKEEHWKCQDCCGTRHRETTLTPVARPNGDVAGGSNPIDERARLNLKLLADQKAHLLKELELDFAQQLERKKLELEKEALKIQFDILNGSSDGGVGSTGPFGTTSGAAANVGRNTEWMSRLNQVTACTNQLNIASASTTTISTTNSENAPQFSFAKGNKFVQPSSTIPSFTSTTSTSATTNQLPTSAGVCSTRTNYDHPSHELCQASGFLHEFQSGRGPLQLDSSTPTTKTNWANPTLGYTIPTQCLPTAISSVIPCGSYPLVGRNVSQPYQVTNSVGNIVSVGQASYPQYTNSSVGPINLVGNPMNVNQSFVHPLLSSSVPQQYSQVYPVNYSLPAMNPNVSQVPLPNYQVPLLNQQMPGMNGEINTPTSRQMAARHVMSKELPVFSGNPEEWPMFFSAFNTSTEACGYSDVENLGRLQRCLKGAALEAVRSRLLLPASVPQVIQTLQLLYGRPEQIIYALLSKIRDVPAPKAENLQSLIAFGMAVQNFCDHLEAAAQVAHLSNPVLLQELVDKLPAHLKLEWVTFKRQFLVVDLRVFGRYISNLVSAAAEVSLNVDIKGTKLKKEEKVKSFVNAHLSPTSSTESPKPRSESSKAVASVICLTCGKPDHKVRECETFKKMNREDRWKVVHTNFLCRTCLGKHGRKPCRSQARCDVQGCQMKHHPLLHGSATSSTPTSRQTPQQANSTPPENQNEGVNAHRTANSTLFRILPVKLFNKERTINTLAFIDEGLSVMLMDRSLAYSLQAIGPKKRLCLTWTGNITRDEEDSMQVEIEIAGTGAKKRYVLDDVRTVESLALPKQTLRYKELAERYRHLKKLPIQDFESEAPGILIGAKHTNLTATQQIREGELGEPIAAKTRLGWAIYGAIPKGTAYPSYNLHICGCDLESDLHELVKQHFTVENTGVSADSSPESEDDKRARAILNATTKLTEGGFETGLLWRYDNVEFPASYAMAVRRLQCLGRQLKKSPEVMENVDQQIMEYQRKGYIHEATEAELCSADPRWMWYLPVGIVRNPKKPSKIRIVWDAAATVDGVSLNSMLLKGPDLVVPLLEVLCGFRERRIAIVGDIREMFHQLKMRQEDRYSQLFVWFGESEQQLKTFIIDVATFGSTCSPCSAQFVKNLNAAEHAEQYPKAAEATQRRHYVDDYLQSFDSEEEACQVVEEVKLVHRQGGFDIRNWLSNSSAVLEWVGEADRTPAKIVGGTGNEMERVLGMQWNAKNDMFLFSSDVNVEAITPTKRNILRCVMSLFDPLGLLSHFLIHGRVIIQDIWRTKAGWDDIVEGPILNRWRVWAGMFNELGDVQVPRAYFPGISSDDIDDLQLHIFVDGSETAYACVAYLRASINGEYHSALVSAKAKVAPLKALSIPRLELQAALIGCRLMKTLCSSHSLQIKRRIFWTDSKTVLSWIHSDHRRYRQFVACRIGEILAKSNPEEWRYVPSGLNSADDGTKWRSKPNLKPDGRWFRGPEFLKRSEEMWPKQANKLISPKRN